MINEEKEKALEITLKNLHKKYGKESINIMKNATIADVETITTGSIGLDLALGVGGIPKGRIIEIFGPESSGKTTLALGILAQAQKKGEKVVFLDVEQAMSIPYAQSLGIDTEEMIFSQPNSGEEVMDMIEMLCNSGAVGLIVLDSVAAIQTKAEIDGDMGDAHIGQVARLMSQSLKKIISSANKTKTSVIFINQIRDKIGVMGYGPKTTTTGGNALKFYSSVRIEVKRIATIKDKEIPIGNRVKMTIAKNKVAAPFKVTETEIIFGQGISKISELIDYAVKYDIIDKAGSWFSYGAIKLGQGKNKVLDFLKNDETILKEIETQVMAKLYPKIN